MKSSKLFFGIKKGLEQYKHKLEHDPKDMGENNSSIGSTMSRYNRDNFNEIMNLSLDELNDNEIPGEEVDDFKKRIDFFFSLYGGRR
ncbi:hypothetical protein [Methanobacterium sp. ACI-7]|uniref:hypothetical protein n=1 Tax=unclassified Methanobacterium TaxID=2627676 RepID=UPI0039C01BEF